MNRSESLVMLVVFIAVFIAGFAIGFANNPKCDCRGDVNLDGVIDSGDLQLIAQHISGTITLEGGSLERADMNNDGVVNGLDLIYYMAVRSE